MGLYLLAIVGVIAAMLGVLGGFYWAHKKKTGVGTVPPTPFSRILGVCLLMLGIASALQLVYFQTKQERIADCQYEVNVALIEVLSARNEATGKQNEKLNLMVKTIKDAKSVQQTQDAMQAFLTASEELKSTRNANPIPDIKQCR